MANKYYTFVVPAGEQYAGKTFTYQDMGLWDPTKVYVGAHDGNGNTTDANGNPIVGHAVHYQGGIFFAHYWNTDMNPMFDNPGYSGIWFNKPDSPPIYGEGIKPLAVEEIYAGEVTDGSMVVFWEAAEVRGPQPVTSYNVYVDGIKVGVSTTTSFKIDNLDPSTSYKIEISAVNGAGASPLSTINIATEAPQIENGKYYSPYIDMTLPSTNIIELARDANLTDMTLAFMQTSNAVLDSNGFLKDGMVPSLAWGGIENTTLPTGVIIEQIKQLQAAGGTITISLGGYTGRDLAVTCADYAEDLRQGGMSEAAANDKAAELLQSLYQSIIDTYGVTHLDFDVENSVYREFWYTDDNVVESTKIAVVDDVEANILRYRAINGLKADNPDLHVSLTVATHPGGVSDKPSELESDPRFHKDGSGNVKALIELAAEMGVDLDVVNIMAMDYFDGPAANPDMGDNAIRAAKAMHELLLSFHLFDTKVGITPMLGQNDAYNGLPGGPGNEVFTLDDARDLVDFFASTPWMAGLGAWQLTRDRANDVDTTGNGPDTQGSRPVSDSTGVIQGDFEFSSILEQIGQWRATGGRGDDHIVGRAGNDTLRGNEGKDTLEGLGGKDTLYGGGGEDVLRGGDDDDRLYGDGSNDWLEGGRGNDTLDGGSSNDTLYGGEGNDTLLGNTGSDKLYGEAGMDTLEGGDGNDTLDGGEHADTLRGGIGNDTLMGGLGNDKLFGDAGADKLYGGVGSDRMFGGADADIFIYKSIAESTVAAAGRDTIYDFSRSQGDKISLTDIDANTLATGNQAFTYIGTGAFTKVAGQLRIEKAPSDTYVSGDVNGDGVADFQIHFDTVVNFSASDFLL